MVRGSFLRVSDGGGGGGDDGTREEQKGRTERKRTVEVSMMRFVAVFIYSRCVANRGCRFETPTSMYISTCQQRMYAKGVTHLFKRCCARPLAMLVFIPSLLLLVPSLFGVLNLLP